MARDLLILTHLTLQESGNQLLPRMVRSFLEEGWTVRLLTAVPSDYPGQVRSEVWADLRRQGMEVVRMVDPFRPLFHLLRWCKRALRRRRRNATVIPSWYGASRRLPYFFDDGWGATWLRALSWFLFQPLGFLVGAFCCLKRRPSLVMGYEIYGAPCARLLACLCGVPLVLKFQGVALEGEELRQARYAYYRWALSTKADVYLMENDGTRGLSKLVSLGVPADRILFLRDGTDLDVFRRPCQDGTVGARRNLPLPKDAVVFLTVAKLKPWKRVDRIIRVFSECVRRYGGETMALVVVGDGPERTALERYASSLGVSDKVVFLGALPYAELGAVYASADVFVLMNDVSNLSNMVYEAMASGLPFLTLADGSTSPLLDENNAVLLPLDAIDTEGPAAMWRLASAPALRRRLGEVSRERVKSLVYSWEEWSRQEMTFLRSRLPHLFEQG